MATIAPRPHASQERRGSAAEPPSYHVVLYNDDIHTFDEVVRQVRKATGVSEPEAVTVTLCAHRQGRAICFAGFFDACERVAAILREIRLQVEIDRQA